MIDPTDPRPGLTTRLRARAARGLRELGYALGVEEPVLGDLHMVLTIPKTGTYTLLAFLQRLGLAGEVRAAYHQLGWQRPAEEWERDGRTRDFLVNGGWERGRVTERWTLHRHLRGRAIHARCIPPSKVSVVVSTREPVSRQLSGIFFRERERRESVSAGFAMSRLLDRSPERTGVVSGGRWWELDTWFDRNVKANFGIGVFAEPFDAARGWQIYEGEDARVLLIRQESFANLPEAARTFYGLRSAPEEIPHANAGHEHGYDAAYREAKEKIRLPGSLLDEVYGARYARHFYSPAELAGFRRRWEER